MNSAEMQVAYFLRGECGQIFCTGSIGEPVDSQRPLVVLVSPFAEELNSSRRFLAVLSRALYSSGFDVVHPDLFGTGDSEGDFGESNFQIWRSDIDSVIAHHERTGPVHFLGVRAGAFLAAESASRYMASSLTLVQPVLLGQDQLNQVLRLRVMSSLFAGSVRETTGELQEKLVNGDSLEVGGYLISSRMANELLDLNLSTMRPPSSVHVNWIDITGSSSDIDTWAVDAVVANWRSEGTRVSKKQVACDEFWASPDATLSADLVEQTVRLMQR